MKKKKQKKLNLKNLKILKMWKQIQNEAFYSVSIIKKLNKV